MRTAPPWPSSLRSPMLPLLASAIVGAGAVHRFDIPWLAWLIPCFLFLLARQWRIAACVASIALGGFSFSSAWSRASPPHWTGAGCFHCCAEEPPTPVYSGWHWKAECTGNQTTRIVRIEGTGAPPECIGSFLIWARWKPWKTQGRFDEVAFYASRGIAGRLLALDAPDWTRASDPEAAPLKEWIQSQRQRLRHSLNLHFSAPTLAFLWGISTGDKSEFDPGTRESFARLGLSHVLAVSGYHVGLVGCLPLLFARSRRMWLRRLSLLGIPGIGLYVIYCGSGESALRAWYMTCMLLVGSAFNRKSSLLHSLSLTGWLMLLSSPLSLLKLGTQLSFLAVGGIALGMAAVKLRSPRRWMQAAVLPLSAQAATSPLTVSTFRQFPLAFLPINWLAGPWISWLGMTFMSWLCWPKHWAGFDWLTKCLDFQVSKLLWMVQKLAAYERICFSVTEGAVVAWVLGSIGTVLATITCIRRGNRFWLFCTAGCWAIIPWTMQSTRMQDWTLMRGKRPSICIQDLKVTWEKDVVRIHADSIGLKKNVPDHWTNLQVGFCYLRHRSNEIRVFGLVKKGAWEFGWDPQIGLGALQIDGHVWIWEQWHGDLSGEWPSSNKKGAEAPHVMVNSNEATASLPGQRIPPTLEHLQSGGLH